MGGETHSPTALSQVSVCFRVCWRRFDVVEPPVQVVAKVRDGPFHRDERAGSEISGRAALDTFANGLVLGKEVLHRICGCADGLGDRPGEPAQDEPRETEHTLRRERVAERSPDPHDPDYRRAAEATGPPRLRVSCGLPGGVSAERGLFEHLEY